MNLKHLDEATLVQALEERCSGLQAVLESHKNEAIAALRKAVRAAKELPPNLDALLLQAEAVFIEDVEDAWGVGRAEVELRLGGRTYRLGSFDVDVPVPRKGDRLRVITLLVPVKEEG